ncbi:hypothetical protein AB0O91_41200 [Kitasatospora sp. NPDC089797]|uniref:hypothetical protein n=1 Tax=Kitasatospora sp. NPDC089797 TaxID=3155298 RepID=UPI00341E75DD
MLKRVIVGTAAAALLALGAGPAFADTSWGDVAPQQAAPATTAWGDVTPANTSWGWATPADR